MTQEEAVKLAKTEPYLLYTKKQWCNNKEVVLATVKQSGLNLSDASNELKNDKML